MTLTEFLIRRITEDETRVQGVWQGDDPDFVWGPDRIRDECEAKRRIVELHNVGNHTCQGPEHSTWVPDCHTLRFLALPYADHPDYREEWKP